MDRVKYIGIGLMVVGALFALFPSTFSQTVIYMLAGAMILGGVYLFYRNYKQGSGLFNFLAGTLALGGIIIWLNPGFILGVIGFFCIVSGLGGIMVQRNGTKGLLYPVCLLLLGGFAVLNTRAASTTLFFLLGIIMFIGGLLLLIKGKQLLYDHVNINIGPKGFYQQRSSSYKKEDEDVIDVEFYESKDDK